MFRKQNSGHFSDFSDGSGGHIRIDRTAARPVGQSPTATNALDPVTSERGGLTPLWAVEPWLLLLYYYYISQWLMTCVSFLGNVRTQYTCLKWAWLCLRLKFMAYSLFNMLRKKYVLS
jgi:hypothetical protein